MKKNNLFIIIYLFLFIYYPPLLRFNILHILTLFSLFSIAIWYKEVAVKIFKRTKLGIIIIPSIIAIIYLTIVQIFMGNYLAIYPYILLVVEVPSCVLYICLYLDKHKYNLIDTIKLLLTVGTIQAVIAFFAFFNANFQNQIIDLMIKNRYSEILNIMSGHRIYGFSNNLTYTTPIVQSILGIIAIYLAVKINIKYILFAPLLIFSGIINARTSFIILLVGLFLMVFFLELSRKTLFRMIIIIITMCLITPIIISFINMQSNDTFTWLNQGFKEILAFFSGSQIGYFYTVKSSGFTRLPDNLGLIFGTGETIFGVNNGSDIGFINDIWLGGLLFSCLNYYGYLRFYFKYYRNENNMIKYFSSFLLIVFLIGNIKGLILSNNDFINFSVLLISVCHMKFNIDEIKILKDKC